ncbi:MAG: MBL fold metallo-hydrolase [Acidimicrobiales bacterium]
MTGGIFAREEYLKKHYDRDPTDFSAAGNTTKVVMLGSGNPFPNPLRRGPCVAVVANGVPYFVDAGEGIWRGIAHAVSQHRDLLGDAFTIENIQHLFLTHLHCDHTVGLPSFILSPYKFNAPSAKRIFGSPGTVKMVEHIVAAYAVDIDAAWKRSGHNPEGWRATGHDISEPGVIFEDDNVSVEALKTEHAPLDYCWAFRFTTSDRVVVIGGDGCYSDGLVEAATGADLFLADIVSEQHLALAPWGGELRDRVAEIKRYHLIPRDLVRLQARSGVDTVVLYHEQGFLDGASYTREALADEVRALDFGGRLISSIDGDIF